MDTPSAPPDPRAPTPRLNLFALPSRTTLLFLLIVSVIYIPLFAAFTGNTPVCAPFLLFWMIALPLRHFLRAPRREIETHHLTDTTAADFVLTANVEQAARHIAQVTSPRVMLSPNAADSARTFGTFRRAYLVFSNALARAIGNLLQGDAAAAARGQAIVLHELAHFRHNDVWLAALARSVLVVTIGFMTLALGIHLLTPFLSYRALSAFDFTQPPFAELLSMLARTNPEILKMFDPKNPIQAARWLDYAIFIFSAFMPLILGSGLLLLFYWRALIRTRELYADARVAQWQNGNVKALEEGLWVAGMLQNMQPAATGWREKIAGWRNPFGFTREEKFTRRQTWLSLHPSEAQRRACLAEPHRVYGDMLSIGLAAGVAVALLNLNLLSLFYSQTLRGPNSVPAFALGFIVIALSLLPFQCRYPEKRRALFCQMIGIVLIFTLIKLIPQGLGALVLLYALFVDSSLFQRGLEGFVRGDLPAGFAVSVSGLVLENYILRPLLLFAVFMPVFLIGYLWFDAWLKRRILYWFRADFLTHHSGFVFAYQTVTLAVILIFILLPFVDWLTIPTAHDPFAPTVLAPMLVVGLLALLHALGFVILDRRYARHCPQCNAFITGHYELGMDCPQCGARLNAWLVFTPRPPIPNTTAE